MCKFFGIWLLSIGFNKYWDDSTKDEKTRNTPRLQQSRSHPSSATCSVILVCSLIPLLYCSPHSRLIFYWGSFDKSQPLPVVTRSVHVLSESD